MIKLRKHLGAVAAIALALICAAAAYPDPVPPRAREALIRLDPAQTEIDFILPGSLHTTHGTFHLQSGSIDVDTQTGKASGKIVVDAASGDSGDSLRDARMKNSILETARYPEIVFVPVNAAGKIDEQGAFHGTLTGMMYLHGGGHQVTMETLGQVQGGRVTASAHFVIPYVQWGLEDPSMLFLKVSKSVDLKIITAGDVTWIPGSSP